MTTGSEKLEKTIYRIYVEGRGYWDGSHFFLQRHGGWDSKKEFQEALDALYDVYEERGLTPPKVEVHTQSVIIRDNPVEIAIEDPLRKEYRRVRRLLMPTNAIEHRETKVWQTLQTSLTGQYQWVVIAEAVDQPVKIEGVMTRIFHGSPGDQDTLPWHRKKKRLTFIAARSETELVLAKIAFGNFICEPIRLWPDLPQ